MLFNSYTFLLLFLPASFLVYHALLRHASRFAIPALALASLVFYTWWDARFLPILLTSIAVNYCFGVLIVRRVAAGQAPAAKLLLTMAVILNLSALAYFKYIGFIADVWAQLTGAQLLSASILLPLGVSFFTFTQITFLVDAASGKATDTSLPRYVLFVTYFPHLIAGPILHHAEMMPQFNAVRSGGPWGTNLAVGIGIFSLGLFKKVVLADSFAPFAEALFRAASNGSRMNLFEAWAGVLSYYFQIYFDFSGYSDMAIGLSLLFGVRLPLNFDSPYKATSIIDFWRRWHITLSRFLREYLYIPLGGNRHGATRRHLNLFITMLLGGLWHGAGYTFLVWGALHGAFLAVNHGWAAFAARHPVAQALRRTRGWSIFAWTLTTIAVLVAWVFFRADNMAAAGHIVQAMTSADALLLPPPLESVLGARFRYGAGWLAGAGDARTLLALLILGFVIVLALPSAVSLFNAQVPTVGRQAESAGWIRLPAWKPALAWATVIALTLAFAFSRITNATAFLYFNF